MRAVLRFMETSEAVFKEREAPTLDAVNGTEMESMQF